MAIKRVLTAAALIAALAAAGGWYSGFADRLLDNSNGGIAACENGLISTLKAPSSYKRISVMFQRQPPLDFEDYKRFSITGGCVFSEFNMKICTGLPLIYAAYSAKQSLAEEGIRKPSQKQMDREREKEWADGFSALSKRPRDQQLTGLATVTYDASNAYGAMIRETRVCRFGPNPTGRRYTDKSIFDDSYDVR